MKVYLPGYLFSRLRNVVEMDKIRPEAHRLAGELLG